MKKEISVIFIVIFFLFAFIVVFLYDNNQSDTAHDYLRIYIRSDGSVWPEETPIQLIDGIYFFVGNVTRQIHLQKSNIVLDGNGYYLEPYGSESRAGPQNKITNVNNVTLRHIKQIDSSLILTNSSFCNIIDTNFCVQLIESHNNSITESYSGGASLVDSQNNTISNNAYFGISLRNSFNNKILNNRMNWVSTCALEIEDSNNNLFFNNQISLQCQRWIILEGSSTQNLFVANQIDGHFVVEPKIDAKNNSFFQNNFIDVFKAKYNETGKIRQINNWNQNLQGNYWNDYLGQDANNDGIGDTPYIINHENQDNYPIIAPLNLEQIAQPKLTPYKVTEDSSLLPFNLPTEIIAICIVIALIIIATIARAQPNQQRSLPF